MMNVPVMPLGSTPTEMHVTTFGGAQYGHSHPTVSLPCPGEVIVSNAQVTVSTFSLAMFYGCLYFQSRDRWTVVGSASLTQNCHGLTTGYGNYMGTGFEGVGLVLSYDFTTNAPLLEKDYAFFLTSTWFGQSHHSYTLQSNGKILEKFGVSPIFEVQPPSLFLEGGNYGQPTMYKKK